MSDSTPAKTPKAASESALGVRRRDRWDTVWWLVSCTLHLVAYGALVWLTPLRTLIFKPVEPAEFEVSADADQIRHIVEEIRDIQADENAWKVEEMLYIEEDLEQLRDLKFDQFEEFAETFARDAPSLAIEAQDQALQAQDEALGIEQKTHASQQQLARSQQVTGAENARPDADHVQPAQERAVETQDGIMGAQETAREAQVRVGQAQATAGRMLSMSGPHMAPAAQAQQQADTAQTRADEAEIAAQEAQQAARKAQNDALNARKRFIKERDRAREERAAADGLRPQADETQRAAEAAKAVADRAKTGADEAKREADLARQQARTSGTGDAKARADAAQKKAESLAREAKQASAQSRDRSNAARGASSRAAISRKRAEAAEQKAAGSHENVRTAQDEAGRLQTVALQTQADARQAQVRARDAQRDARKVLTDAMATRPEQVDIEVPRPQNTGPNPRPYRMNLADLYETAVQAERRIADAYKSVRATDFAMISKVPLQQATDQTDVAKPMRPQLDRKLLTGDVRTTAGVRRHNQEVEKAVTQIESMATLARRVHAAARGGEGEGGVQLSLDWVLAMSDHYEESAAAALEDETVRAKDLTDLMKAAPAAGGKQQKDGGKASSSAAAPAAGPGASQAAAGKGGRAGRAGYWAILDELPSHNVIATPGRKIFTGAPPSHPWMYVDSWYTIGPFPNPQRRNIDRQFPPESVVDLDAVYQGKDERPLRWKFVQSGQAAVIPADDEPYGIWYAYTELWFDRPMDLWVAVGSDDKSKMWINDHAVWVSGSRLKSWRANEGFRKVHFRKGLNRVLYRIENGWRSVVFSLLICTRTQSD